VGAESSGVCPTGAQRCSSGAGASAGGVRREVSENFTRSRMARLIGTAAAINGTQMWMGQLAMRVSSSLRRAYQRRGVEGYATGDEDARPAASASTSSAVMEPGFRPVRANSAERSCTTRFTGVGTPNSTPSAVISPFR